MTTKSWLSNDPNSSEGAREPAVRTPAATAPGRRFTVGKTSLRSALVMLSSAAAAVAGTGSPARADEAKGGATLEATTTTAPAADAPKARGGGAGLGLSPNTPQLGGGTNLNSKEAEELTPTVSSGGEADEWKFSFHGYLRGPMRVSFGPPTPSTAVTMGSNAVATSGTQLHGWPRVPGANFITWDYTNTIPGPWAQLNFSYGNSRAMMTIIVDSYGQTSGGYRDLQAQQGIDQAWVTLNFPEALGNAGGLVLNVGSFQNRYGTAGKYDAGMYETYLFGRTHVAGETLTANIDTGTDWGLTVEHGIGSKIEIIPFTNNQLYQLAKSTPGATGWGSPPHLSDREFEYLPYAGPVPQGSTFLTHLHVGAAYKKIWTVGAHLLYTWTPDDNWDSVNSKLANVSDAVPRKNGPTTGSMLVAGADVRLNGGVYGDGYIGFSHIDAKNINALADSLELLHSDGGWQFKQNFFGLTFNPNTGVYNGPENESGKVDTIEWQYTFSFGALARYPAAFWGDGPDLTVTTFGMFSMVKSPIPAETMIGAPNAKAMDTNKLKLGLDTMYTPLSWFGIGGRIDNVQPDLSAVQDGSKASFTVVSPRLVLKTNFVTHEAVTLVYQHYFLGDRALPVYPYQWVAKADADVIALSGTMWW